MVVARMQDVGGCGATPFALRSEGQPVGPPVGRVGALLAIVIAGTVAIFHYSSPGAAVASSPDPSAVTAQASTAATLRARSAAPASGQGGAAHSKTTNGRTVNGHAVGSGQADTSGATGAAATSGSPPAPPGLAPGATSGTAPVHFRTLPPGAALPTGAECALGPREPGGGE